MLITNLVRHQGTVKCNDIQCKYIKLQFAFLYGSQQIAGNLKMQQQNMSRFMHIRY